MKTTKPNAAAILAEVAAIAARLDILRDAAAELRDTATTDDDADRFENVECYIDEAAGALATIGGAE